MFLPTKRMPRLQTMYCFLCLIPLVFLKMQFRPNLLLVSDVIILLLKSFKINSVSCFSWHTHNCKQKCRTVTLFHSMSSLSRSPLISFMDHLWFQFVFPLILLLDLQILFFLGWPCMLYCFFLLGLSEHLPIVNIQTGIWWSRIMLIQLLLFVFCQVQEFKFWTRV